jgi:quercetin dioxygenase-like cupin family protein
MPKKLSAKIRDEVVYKADVPYEDGRGRLDYFVMPEPIHWVGVATSKKGSVRANHWHPKQQQVCLILSGKVVSVYKDLTKKDSPLRHQLAVAGDLVVTPPRIAHAVIYLEDTSFLNLVNGERDPSRWGTHTKAYEIVTPADVTRIAAEYGFRVRPAANGHTGQGGPSTNAAPPKRAKVAGRSTKAAPKAAPRPRTPSRKGS